MTLLYTRELRDRLFSTFESGDVIDYDTARTIASQWHMPNTVMSKMSQGIWMTMDELKELAFDIRIEMRDCVATPDIEELSELYVYVRTVIADTRRDDIV